MIENQKKCVVVIPAYKVDLNDSEILSIRQCLSVLNKYDFRLVCPEKLDTSTYEQLFSEYNKNLETVRFDLHFFRSIDGYNALLLSKDFYTHFIEWEYMLIYQPDAFVFRDELEYWCSQGYDYIGAPWRIVRTTEIDPINSGNGGLSLRKVNSMLDALTNRRFLLSLKGLKYLYEERGPYRKPYLLIRGIFGFQNSVKSIIEKDLANEDKFFAMQRYRRKKPLKVPNSDVAMFFSFEQDPSFLFEQTGNKLPFGCHAWEKYEYDSFWKKYIK